METYDIKNIYSYHSSNVDQENKYESIRRHARKLAELFLQDCPSSRERSLALTNLEQAMFWANASIARNE